MSTTIPQTFITEFEALTKDAYQEVGPKLLGTHRLSSNINGNEVRFPKIGTARAFGKPRGAQMVASNTAHDSVTATLDERFVRDDFEEYDQFKTNVNFRNDYARAHAMALGREQDQFVISALSAGVVGGNIIDDDDANRGADSGLNKETLLYLGQLADEANVPSEDRWWVIAPAQKYDLLNLTEFTSADFNVRKEFANPSDGMFRFNGFNFIVHNALPTELDGGDTLRHTFLYHAQAVGSASPNAFSMRARIDDLIKERAGMLSSSFSMASTVIDNEGLWQVNCNEGV